MPTVTQKYEKEYEKALRDFKKRMDQLYEDYKYKLGKDIGNVPSQRPDFEPCSPKYVRKYIKYMPEDKVKTEEYLSDMLNVCTTCAVKQREVPKAKRKMSGWNCFLKMCAAEDNGMNFQECMKNKTYKEKEYVPNKEKYNQLAMQGCPID